MPNGYAPRPARWRSSEILVVRCLALLMFLISLGAQARKHTEIHPRQRRRPASDIFEQTYRLRRNV